MAHEGAQAWYDHANEVGVRHAEGVGHHMLTPTQEKLIAWAKRCDENDWAPGSKEAAEDLRLDGFDPDYPPAV
jgi:hypothetical protein